MVVATQNKSWVSFSTYYTAIRDRYLKLKNFVFYTSSCKKRKYGKLIFNIK